MLRKTIKFTDFNGVEKEKVYCFNLTDAELTQLNFSVKGGLEKKLEDIIASQDMNEILSIFKEIILLWKKNSLDKNDPKRAVVKQILELIYGKGLQKHDFKTDGLCRHHWAQGRNYIQPHMAYHCTALQRYKMMTIIKKAGGDVENYDTDSITGQNLESLIEEDNERIMCENTFYYDEKLDIGTWEKEYEEDVTEVILAPKQRIIFTKKGIITKVAGIKKADLMANINALLREYNNDYNKVIDYLLVNGIDDFIITTYEFDVDNGFRTHYETYAEYNKRIASNLSDWDCSKY